MMDNVFILKSDTLKRLQIASYNVVQAMLEARRDVENDSWLRFQVYKDNLDAALAAIKEVETHILSRSSDYP